MLWGTCYNTYQMKALTLLLGITFVSLTAQAQTVTKKKWKPIPAHLIDTVNLPPHVLSYNRSRYPVLKAKPRTVRLRYPVL